MEKTGKRGATLVHVLMAVGLLIIGAAAIASFQRIISLQKTETEQDFTKVFAERLSNAITQAQTYPTNAEHAVKIPSTTRYDAEVKDGLFRLTMPETGTTQEYALNTEGINIINSKFSNYGEVKVYRQANQLYIAPELTCREEGNECDPGCILKQRCPESCKQTIDTCNPSCLKGINPNEKEKCIPACYSNKKKGAYDPRCIVQGDDICDPDTHMQQDGICDNDCPGQNSVCDPDCNLPDIDCPSKGNMICEPDRGESCENTADCACGQNELCRNSCAVQKNDKGCIPKTELTKETKPCRATCQCTEGLICDYTSHCCPQGKYFDAAKNQCVSAIGDGKCERRPEIQENCVNSPEDCSCSAKELGPCCPTCQNTGETGCCPKNQIRCGEKCIPEPATKLGEAKQCGCSEQCEQGLKCSQDKEGDKTSACCPAGKEWDSRANTCKETKQWQLVVVPINYNLDDASQKSDFMTKSQTFSELWKQVSPFNKCPEKVKLLLAENCPEAASACLGLSENPELKSKACEPGCGNAIIRCATSKYTEFDKAEGLFRGVISDKNGILGCSSLTDILNNPPPPKFIGNKMGGAVSQSHLNDEGLISAHEMGHDFGLCHTGPGVRLFPSCPNPDIYPVWNPRDIMLPAYTGVPSPIGYEFLPKSYEYLKIHPHLKEFYEGCE
ncbi:hypothetical protein HY640_04650 [Candidatus Woesearchaeota archaeon]|nr:hypothetical protein [Candidatus Woesearchaeota archaeon]